MTSGNLMIVQGGGPTAVFNASLASIIAEAQQHAAIPRIYGARFGMKGLASNDIAELTHVPADKLERLRHTPGAALGSSRFAPTEHDLNNTIAHLRALRVSRMIFLGGNGTMSGAQSFSDFCKQRDFPLQVMGTPKTIDNDICSTDRCPGYGSAARFVAQSTLDLSMDLRALHQPVSIFETLGRDVGWLSAASLLARRSEHDAPHVICIPEIPFVLDDFLARIDATISRIGWAVAVVSEGTCYADGTPVFVQTLPSGGKTPVRPLIGGVAQHLSGFVAQHLGLRCRSEKPGLIGRSASAHVSSQDLADAQVTGRECVRSLLQGATDLMVSLRPLGASTEDQRTTTLPLLTAAGPRRALPADWLRHDGLAVGQNFLDYLTPIVGPLHRYETLWSEASHP